MVAAGSGSRLGAAVPKALVEVGGVALVRHAVDALVAGGIRRVVVAVPVDHAVRFAAVLSGAVIRPEIIVGGPSRQESVRLAATALSGEAADTVVLVHDAARPFVPPDLVKTVVQAVRSGAEVAVPALPVADSIRRLEGESTVVVDRTCLRAVQTPQGLLLRTLVAAHTHLASSGLEVTDDAAAAESIGCRVTLVPGHPDAFKVTEPHDLVLAGALLAGRRP